jgi:carotenoid cleavage dioxygenase-like enzyme
VLTGVVHLDLATGKSDEWEAPEGDAVSEAVFAPRAPDAPEGEG